MPSGMCNRRWLSVDTNAKWTGRAAAAGSSAGGNGPTASPKSCAKAFAAAGSHCRQKSFGIRSRSALAIADAEQGVPSGFVPAVSPPRKTPAASGTPPSQSAISPAVPHSAIASVLAVLAEAAGRRRPGDRRLPRRTRACPGTGGWWPRSGSMAASHSSSVAPVGGNAKRDRGFAGGDADGGLPAAADQVGQHGLDLAFAGPEAVDPSAPDDPSPCRRQDRGWPRQPIRATFRSSRPARRAERSTRHDAAAVAGNFQIDARRGAVRIVDHPAPGGKHRLHFVLRRHRPLAPGEQLANVLQSVGDRVAAGDRSPGPRPRASDRRPWGRARRWR